MWGIPDVDKVKHNKYSCFWKKCTCNSFSVLLNFSKMKQINSSLTEIKSNDFCSIHSSQIRPKFTKTESHLPSFNFQNATTLSQLCSMLLSTSPHLSIYSFGCQRTVRPAGLLWINVNTIEVLVVYRWKETAQHICHDFVTWDVQWRVAKIRFFWDVTPCC
jgi:hypothetical protein